MITKRLHDVLYSRKNMILFNGKAYVLCKGFIDEEYSSCANCDLYNICDSGLELLHLLPLCCSNMKRPQYFFRYNQRLTELIMDCELLSDFTSSDFY